MEKGREKDKDRVQTQGWIPMKHRLTQKDTKTGSIITGTEVQHKKMTHNERGLQNKTGKSQSQGYDIYDRWTNKDVLVPHL